MRSSPNGQPILTGYRPDIDGLRAVAVLAVILYHAGFVWIPAAFVGVDVFFVISGYVITRGLLREAAGGGIGLAAFYARRIRRILPALTATLAVTSLAAWWILLPPQFEDYAGSAAASALSVANLYFWRASGYFDAAALYRPLLHTWSLSVEEQFYLVLPVSLLLALRLRLRPLWWPFALAALLSLALSLYAGRAAPTANFYLLPTRAWELLAGTLLAMAPPAADDAGARPAPDRRPCRARPHPRAVPPLHRGDALPGRRRPAALPRRRPADPPRRGRDRAGRRPACSPPLPSSPSG